MLARPIAIFFSLGLYSSLLSFHQFGLENSCSSLALRILKYSVVKYTVYSPPPHPILIQNIRYILKSLVIT